MRMKKLRVAVVGCGLIAKARHIPSYIRMKKNVDLCAVCDRDKNLARDVAIEYRIPKTYQDVSKMLSEEDLDIIDICTPPQTHASIAIEAMENGCHVLTEKPMALKTLECNQMIDASRKHKVKLGIVHNTIFHSPFIKAKKLVAEGAIGDFVGMRIYISTPISDMMAFKDHWIHRLPGGVLGETGPHAVYMSLAFLKNIKNVDVYAEKKLGYPWAPFDEFRVELEGKNGISSLALSYARNCWAMDVDILGTEASLHLDLESMLLIRHQIKELTPLSIGRSSLSGISQMVSGMTSNIVGVITGKQRIGHDVVIEKFVDSVLNDSQLPVTGEEGREVVRVMEMVVERYRETYGDKVE